MSLLDEINQHSIQQPKRAKGAGRQLFVAQKADIQEALDAGYPMTEVWQYLNDRGRMPICYRVFIEYVHRFITNSQKDKEKGTTKNEAVTGIDGVKSEPERLPLGYGGSSRIAAKPALRDAEDPRNHPDSDIFNI